MKMRAERGGGRFKKRDKARVNRTKDDVKK